MSKKTIISEVVNFLLLIIGLPFILIYILGEIFISVGNTCLKIEKSYENISLKIYWEVRDKFGDEE